MDIKKTTYDISPHHDAPTVGRYVVSVGKKGPLSVSIIHSVRIVKAKVSPRIDEYGATFIRYALEIIPQPGLLINVAIEPYEYTDSVGTHSTALVWVKGEPALPFYSHPRGKKK